MDLACSVVEKTASEKAIAEIDEGLGSSFVNRRKHRERTGQPFYDMAVYTSSRYPSTLPESLRLKPNGLSPHQLSVYEDFARISRQTPSQDMPDRVRGPSGGTPHDYAAGGQSEDSSFQTGPAIEKYTVRVGKGSSACFFDNFILSH